MSDAQRLSELLRRSTAQNGGKPPGMRRFLTEHHITETDLHRAGFAKYSELVRSVGFEPVSFANPPYSRDMMLERLALLARQLGHFPTSRERNVARRRDQSFPGEKASRRLSKAAVLEEQLRSWCHAQDAFEDVGALLDKRVPSRDKVKGTVTIRGYVYLMKSGSRFKVGRETTEGSR